MHQQKQDIADCHLKPRRVRPLLTGDYKYENASF